MLPVSAQVATSYRSGPAWSRSVLQMGPENSVRNVFFHFFKLLKRCLVVWFIHNFSNKTNQKTQTLDPNAGSKVSEICMVTGGMEKMLRQQIKTKKTRLSLRSPSFKMKNTIMTKRKMAAAPHHRLKSVRKIITQTHLETLPLSLLLGSLLLRLLGRDRNIGRRFRLNKQNIKMYQSIVPLPFHQKIHSIEPVGQGGSGPLPLEPPQICMKDVRLVRPHDTRSKKNKKMSTNKKKQDKNQQDHQNKKHTFQSALCALGLEDRLVVFAEPSRDPFADARSEDDALMSACAAELALDTPRLCDCALRRACK